MSLVGNDLEHVIVVPAEDATAGIDDPSAHRSPSRVLEIIARSATSIATVRHWTAFWIVYDTALYLAAPRNLLELRIGKFDQARAH
jgi:hypothetical protein